MILVVGSHLATTSQYAQEHELGRSVLYTGTESGTVFHTSIADCPDLKDHISKFDQVYWAESAVDEFSNYQEYFDIVYLLKKYPNVVNINGVDPYNIRQPLSLNNTTDSAVFIGCSHTHGQGLDHIADCYANLVSKHFDVACVNAGSPGKGNLRSFETFNQTMFNKDQIVVLQLTDLARLKYFETETAEAAVQERPLHELKNRSYIDVYNDKQLIYNLLCNIDAVVHRARSNQLRFAFFYLGQGQDMFTKTVEYYLMDYPEYIPEMLAKNVDRGNDGAHFGAQSHCNWAQAVIDKIEKLYI